jgi:hypothetical protein
VLRRLGAHAYGGDVADGPPVRGARARTAARTRCASGGGASGRGTSGGAGANAEARPVTRGAGARNVAAARRSARFCFAGAEFEMNLLKIFV